MTIGRFAHEMLDVLPASKMYFPVVAVPPAPVSCTSLVLESVHPANFVPSTWGLVLTSESVVKWALRPCCPMS